MRLWALTWLGLVLAATSPEADTFQSGDWKGRANFNGKGTFTDCTVLLPDPADTTLGFVMTPEADIGMLVADSALRLKPGEQKPVLVLMEGQNPFAAIADIVAENGVLIPLKKGDPVFDAIAEGSKFRVSVREKEFALEPEGTAEALEALKACVESHRGKNRVEL